MPSCDQVLRRLLVVEGCAAAWFWLPTYFLLFRERFGDETAVALLGAYYVANVVLEVPSGWASDRFGRRATLVAAMAMQCLGAAAIAISGDVAWSLLGQILLAGSASFVSGTDTSLAFEWLRREGRVDEVTRFESRVGVTVFGVGAATVVVGGFASTDHLAAGHALAAVAGLVGVVVALGLRDARERDEVAGHARGEWGRLLGGLRRPQLAWIAAFAVAMHVFNHVPLEFLQPYLAAADADVAGGRAPTAAAGLTLGAMYALASVASRLSPAIGARLGARAALVLAFAAQIAIVWVMALVLHPAVALVVALRGVPHGVAQPLRNARIHDLVEGPLRATWFSALTLAGSLILGGSLLVAARFVGGPLERLDADGLAKVLLAYGVAAAATLVALAATSRSTSPRRGTSRTEED
ncbi:MAG: MFS transporter [Planctomycetota bacterium]